MNRKLQRVLKILDLFIYCSTSQLPVGVKPNTDHHAAQKSAQKSARISEKNTGIQRVLQQCRFGILPLNLAELCP